MIVLHIFIGIALVSGQEITRSTPEGESVEKKYSYGWPMPKYHPLQSLTSQHDPEENLVVSSKPVEAISSLEGIKSEESSTKQSEAVKFTPTDEPIKSSLEQVGETISTPTDEPSISGPILAEQTKLTPTDVPSKYTDVPPTSDLTKKPDDISKSESNQHTQSVPGQVVGNMYKHEIKYGNLSPVAGAQGIEPYEGASPTDDKPEHRIYPEYRNPYYTPREEVELRHGLFAYQIDHDLGLSYRRRHPNRHLYKPRNSNRPYTDSYGNRHRSSKNHLIGRDYVGLPLYPEVSIDPIRIPHIVKSPSPAGKRIRIYGKRYGTSKAPILDDSREVYQPINQKHGSLDYL